MSLEETATEHLFSYGTLQTEALQRATFGRRLEGQPDHLVGYRLAMIEIQDQDFIATSGTAHHRNLQFTGNASDFVAGMVLTWTKQELEQSDAYEPVEYKRVLVQLKSGMKAWVYLSTQQ